MGLIGLNKGLFDQVSETRADVVLWELHERDDAMIDPPLAFQYFPESMTDGKAINYQQKEVPGGSLPLYQWVASGERLISFTAMFTSDMNVIDAEDSDAMLGATKRRNIDVRTALLWLRRNLLPRYATGAAAGSAPYRTYAPRKLRLYIPNSGIGLIGGGRTENDVSDDAITCVMTQCEITYQSWFPNGLPAIAEVQLSFAEVPQLEGRVRFPGVTDDVDNLVRNGGLGEASMKDGLPSTQFYAYSIKPRKLS